jgi:hypothetical protein
MSSARVCSVWLALLLALVDAGAHPGPVKPIALSPVRVPDGLLLVDQVRKAAAVHLALDSLPPHLTTTARP